MAASWRDVLEAKTALWSVEQADCIDFFNALPADSLDLVLGSPPYMDARTYGINAVRDCAQWVDWMLDVTTAAVRASRGLVLWVAGGVQRDNCYWPGCEGLAWEWWKRGNRLWRPCVWWKVDEDEGGTGVPGSGGRQWLRADWEYVLAFKREGWLPWADPLVMGHAPVCSSVGGAMSNRTQDGRRINAAVGERLTDGRTKGWNAPGSTRRDTGKYKRVARDAVMPPGPVHDGEGNIVRAPGRPFPKVANPGNVLPVGADEEDRSGLVVKARVGGGHIGDDCAHLNEAPYPEKLAEFFVRSFCPEGGVASDCFSGGGTTGKVCLKWGRRFVGADIRDSQVQLSRRRIQASQGLFDALPPEAP